MKIDTFWVVKRAVWLEVSAISDDFPASIIRIDVSVLRRKDAGGTRVISERKSVLPLSGVLNMRRALVYRRFTNAIKEIMSNWPKHREEILCSVKHGKFL